ncbi:BRO family protein [Nicoletella semolina]|uniref:BRO family protein n=1 Tax=Nicoletella semolina TaxID=271160 RepID=A0A4R2NAY4_9PAST|nr:BRO family protein [Nicoletella semolina]TCP18102.1 BRO family protein [Nicoletella semolina]
MSNSQILTFDFKSQPVRIQSFNDEPYFCLTDVCFVLGVNRRSSEAFRLNTEGCKEIATLTNGGEQIVTFINEPNLYRIIFRSNKANAVEFQNWVFEEVLPQIRKTGKYLQNQQPNLPLAKPTKDTMSVDVNVFHHLLHLARTASDTCEELMQKQIRILDTFDLTLMPRNRLTLNYELVKEMQFAIDDAEKVARQHIRNCF